MRIPLKNSAAILFLAFLYISPLIAAETNQKPKNEPMADNHPHFSNCKKIYNDDKHTRELELCKLNVNASLIIKEIITLRKGLFGENGWLSTKDLTGFINENNRTIISIILAFLGVLFTYRSYKLRKKRAKESKLIENRQYEWTKKGLLAEFAVLMRTLEKDLSKYSDILNNLNLDTRSVARPINYNTKFCDKCQLGYLKDWHLAQDVVQLRDNVCRVNQISDNAENINFSIQSELKQFVSEYSDLCAQALLLSLKLSKKSNGNFLLRLISFRSIFTRNRIDISSIPLNPKFVYFKPNGISGEDTKSSNQVDDRRVKYMGKIFSEKGVPTWIKRIEMYINKNQNAHVDEKILLDTIIEVKKLLVEKEESSVDKSLNPIKFGTALEPATVLN